VFWIVDSQTSRSIFRARTCANAPIEIKRSSLRYILLYSGILAVKNLTYKQINISDHGFLEHTGFHFVIDGSIYACTIYGSQMWANEWYVASNNLILDISKAPINPTRIQSKNLYINRIVLDHHQDPSSTTLRIVHPNLQITKFPGQRPPRNPFPHPLIPSYEEPLSHIPYSSDSRHLHIIFVEASDRLANAWRLPSLYSLQSLVWGGRGLGEVAGEDWLKEGAENNLSTTKSIVSISIKLYHFIQPYPVTGRASHSTRMNLNV